jgi:hypothetical protein
MNHREEPINNRVRKKISKEIRSAERETTATQPPIRHLRGQNPAQRPSKVVKREQAELTRLKKIIQAKKSKKPAKHSKRTTPGSVPPSSPPRNPHIESGRWMQTVEKQTLSRAQRLRGKLRKQTSKR